MKDVFLFYFLFIFIHLNGQNAPVMQKNTSGNEYKIDFYSVYKNGPSSLSMSQFVEDIEFVPLETKDECLLGEFLIDIVVTKDNILVFDYTKGYRFDRKGKFLNSIGVRGNGPGEYVKAMDMVVDTLNRWVYFSDTRAGQIVKYDFTGNYVDNFKYGPAGYHNVLYKPMWFILENSVYQFAKKGERFSMNFYSEKEKKIVSKFPCDYKLDIPVMAMCGPISYVHKGNFYLKDFWCDTIYRMKDPFHLESHVVINKGKFENRTRNDKSLVTGKEDVRDHMVLGINNIFETDRYLFINSNKGKMIYDKTVQKVLGYKELKSNIKDDLYGSPGLIYLSTYNINGNEMYMYRSAYDFLKAEKNNHTIHDVRYAEYQKMITRLDLEDNPVIMIIKIRK